MGFGDQKHQTQNQMIKFHFHVPHLHFHHHHHHGYHHHVPRGFVAIMVGHEDEEEGLQRFVIPVIYVNHPLFLRLLKEAEEEYGFDHAGPITIPCHVEEFRHVQDIIDEETHRRYNHGYSHNRNHNHNHDFWCFKV